MAITTFGKNKKRILINTVYLTFSNIISRFFYFLIIIYVARKYGPDFFGEFNTALNFVSLLSIFTMLGFDTVVVREGAKKISNVEYLQNNFLPIRLYLSLIIFIIAIILSYNFGYDLRTQRLIRILSFLILIGGHIISGITEHFGANLRIFEKMGILSRIQVLRMLILLILSFLLILFNLFSFISLAFSVVLSSFIALILTINESNKVVKTKIQFYVNLTFLKKYFLPVISFGIVSVITMYGSRLDIQLLNHYNGGEAVGIYSASMNIINIGLMGIGSLHLALYPFTSKQLHNSDYPLRLFKNYLIIVFALVFFIYVLNYFIEDLVILIFGNKYRLSIQPLRILIWLLPFRFLLSWGNQILESRNLFVYKILISLSFFITNIVLNLLLIQKESYIGSAKAALVANVVFALLTVAAAQLYLRKTEVI